MRNRTFAAWAILFACIVVMNGCSVFRFAPTQPIVYSRSSYTPEMYEADLAAYNQLRNQTSPGVSDVTVARRTDLRNKVVYSTAREIDRAYYDFKNAFFGDRATMETLLDIAQIGLSSAGTLAGGEMVKAILAATATGITGSRLSYNKNFFKEKTPDLLLSRMDALRAEQWSQMNLKLTSSVDDGYSLYEAERDMSAYYQAGTLEAAFQNIVAESGATQQKAEEETKAQVARTYGAFIGTLASREERKDIEYLFNKLRSLQEPGREAQAKKVVDNFKLLQPNTPINPGATQPSHLDNVKYLYILATHDYPDVRRDLARAFKDAGIQ